MTRATTTTAPTASLRLGLGLLSVAERQRQRQRRAGGKERESEREREVNTRIRWGVFLSLRSRSRYARTTTSSSLSSLPDTSSLVMTSLPFITLLSFTLAISLVKLTAYSQLEVVRTAMLSRHVKNGGAKVLQLGGTTRDLYYYPPKTLAVTVNDPNLNIGLFEQAGMTVGIPTRATKLSLADALAGTATGSLDAVVSFNQFGDVSDARVLRGLVMEVARVLKAGGTFVFYERRRDGGVAQVGVRGGCVLGVGELVGGLEVWDFAEWDVAAGGLDGHDVGVAVKGRVEGGGEDMGGVEGSVDGSAFEAMIRKGRGEREREREKKKGGGGGGFR